MHKDPSIGELLSGVIDFLNNVAAPQLSGQAQFHARVSANALALIGREIAGRDDSEGEKIALYQALLASELTDAAELSQLLCEQIRSDKLSFDSPALLALLREVARTQLLVDQPTYSGLNL